MIVPQRKMLEFNEPLKRVGVRAMPETRVMLASRLETHDSVSLGHFTRLARCARLPRVVEQSRSSRHGPGQSSPDKPKKPSIPSRKRT
jgi:hypothetical protein